jgi:hypothetical protein
LKPDSLDLNHLQEIDMKKVEALKKAVSGSCEEIGKMHPVIP